MQIPKHLYDYHRVHLEQDQRKRAGHEATDACTQHGNKHSLWWVLLEPTKGEIASWKVQKQAEKDWQSVVGGKH